MSDADDRVQQALAAHLEHLEVGGPAPDVSHLTPAEQDKLGELIGLLDQTQGVAFGHGLDDEQAGEVATTEEGKRLVAELRDALGPGARIASDPAAVTLAVPGIDVAEGWMVGTFGGRVRVWLLAGGLDESERWLRDLGRVFRFLPDTAAVALVAPDHTCLLVQPEDCAPAIEVPAGSLVGRRYRRPLLPAGEALSAFLAELIPYWEPMQDISEQAGRAVEVGPIAAERAEQAISEQAAAGSRARKTNPKRKALTELGEAEAGRLAKLVVDVHEGRTTPDDVEAELRGLATPKRSGGAPTPERSGGADGR